MATQKRLIEFDILRAFAIFGVIMIHILGASFHYWSKGSLTWTVFLILDQLFRFSVPFFVFISGYTLFLKYHQNFKYSKFFLRRVLRIFPWYFFWGLIIYIYLHAYEQPGFVDYPTWKLILLGKIDYHLYFVSMIFQLYLIFPLLRFLFNKFSLAFVCVLFILEAILYVTFSLDAQNIIHLPFRFYDQQQYLFFGTWIFYFVFGFAISQKSPDQTRLRFIRYIFPILTGFFLTYAVMDSLHIISVFSDTNIATRFTRIPILFFSTSFILSAFFYSKQLLKLPKFVIRVLLYLANLSFLIYLIHALVMRILTNFFLPNSVFNLIIFTVLVLTLSIFLAQLSLSAAGLMPLDKIKSLKVFVVGNTKH